MGCSGAKLGKSDRQIAVRRGRRAYIFRTAMVLQCVTHVMMENELLFERPGSRWCIKLFLATYGSFMKAIMRDTRPSIAEVIPNQPVNPQLFFPSSSVWGLLTKKEKRKLSRDQDQEREDEAKRGRDREQGIAPVHRVCYNSLYPKKRSAAEDGGRGSSVAKEKRT